MPEFFVAGHPSPKGSYRAYHRGGKPRFVPDSSKRLQEWTKALSWSAKLHCDTPIEGPVALDVAFRMPRPKRTKRRLPHVTPDLDKLCRAVGDALTGIAYADDAQIVYLTARKVYAEAGEEMGAMVRIWKVDVDA